MATNWIKLYELYKGLWVALAKDEKTVIASGKMAKEALEKAKAQENLAKVDRHIDDWTELAAKTFDFASTAVERFEKGDIEERKTILKAVGSHLILNDQKLTIQARTPFLKIQNALSKIKASERIEPEEKIDITHQTVDLPPQFVVWGPRCISV